MKNIITTIILVFVCFLAIAQPPRFNVTTTDPVTGKKIKYTNQEVRFRNGNPIEFIGTISFHESNDNNATPSGSTAIAIRATQSYTDIYSTAGRFINSVTRVYVDGVVDANGDPIPNAVSLESYLGLKAYNSFPQTAGSDAVWKGLEGICKELFLVRKANGEFVD